MSAYMHAFDWGIICLDLSHQVWLDTQLDWLERPYQHCKLVQPSRVCSPPEVDGNAPCPRLAADEIYIDGDIKILDNN